MGILDTLDLNVALPREEYDRRLPRLQKSVAREALRMYRRKRSVILVFEGMDAAGKGGAIRRVIHELDPELYAVLPFAAPTPEERAHHYLWRFWKSLPEPGRIAVFDRSWYGRVLVERVEGFAKPEEWQRAYREINDMELSWTNAGVVVIKFWLQIGLEEQMDRFKAREESPLKSWKLTDEDWRNREKWPEYKAAIEDMLEKTSTPKAPWHIVEGNDKLYARVKIASIVRERLRSP